MRRLAILIVLLVGIGAAGIAISYAMLIDGITTIDKALSRVESAVIDAPPGSVVVVGADTIAEIRRVGGIRRKGGMADSALMFLAAPVGGVVDTLISPDHMVAEMPRITDWRLPFSLHLRRRRDLQSRRVVGRLVLMHDSSMRVPRRPILVVR